MSRYDIYMGCNDPRENLLRTWPHLLKDRDLVTRFDSRWKSFKSGWKDKKQPGILKKKSLYVNR